MVGGRLIAKVLLLSEAPGRCSTGLAGTGDADGKDRAVEHSQSAW